jgi:hypothetical protein
MMSVEHRVVIAVANMAYEFVLAGAGCAVVARSPFLNRAGELRSNAEAGLGLMAARCDCPDVSRLSHYAVVFSNRENS